MVRDAAGLLALHAVLASAGLALLAALGLVERRLTAVALALGPAYVFGVALVLPVMIALLVLGIPLTWGTLLVVTVVGVVALALVARRRSAPADTRARPPLPRAVLLVVGGAAVLYLLFGAGSLARSATGWDAAHMWSLRGVTLAHHHSLVPVIFSNPSLAGFHLDYPLLQPSLEALAYQAMGDTDVRLLHVVLWVFFGAFVWTLAYLLRRTQANLAWMPVVVLIGLAAGFYPPLETSYADTTVAVLLGSGVLCIGLWIQSWRPEYAILGGIALGAATNAKNEGVMIAAAVLAAAGVIALARRGRPGVVAWAIPAGITVAAALPWRLWVRSHDLPGGDFVPLSEAADPSFLVDRLSRLDAGMRAIMQQLADAGRWHFLPPLMIALALIALVVRGGSRTATLYLATFLLAIFGSASAYWLSNWADVQLHIQASVDRVMISTTVVACVGVAHLVSLVYADRAAITPPPARRTPPPGDPAP